MQYRPFGKTGIYISQLVFGGGAVGGLLIDQPDEYRQQAYEHALKAGINWFDTAPSYGQGRSESALGQLLATTGSPPYVSTKFTIDTRQPGNLEGQIRSSIESSLRRLNMSSATLLQLHNPIGTSTRGRTISAHDVLKSGGVIDCLEKLKLEGVIGHLGITALGDTPAILQIIESDRIDSAQIYYNLLNPSAGSAAPISWKAHDFSSILARCEAHGVAAMNIRVFSAGIIATDLRTGREQPLTPADSVDSEARKASQIFSIIKSDYGSRAQTAIRFALAEKRLSCVIVGLANISHLEEAIAAEQMGALDSAAISRIQAVYAS
jgi:L-galactose dehydrogenase/L-glyceraldehyde 3-phosphate reductase